MRTLDPTLRAFLALTALSAGSVAVAAFTGAQFEAALTGTVVLALAFLKARVIVSRYLGLWQAPGWLAGFSWVLGIYCLLLLGLYLAPQLNF
ncbi:hypothetical protein [Roseibium sp.]|uniref:hypothetical protein n=1 Tax=Roseibium sp. TaxID=1936156 RepID=UPI003D0A584D